MKRAEPNVDNPRAGAAPSRRSFLTLLGVGAVAVAGGGTLAGCSDPVTDEGVITNTSKVDAVLPTFKPMDLVKPDLPGVRPVADGFLNYPKTLIDAITDKPGKGGPTIKAMTPWWGPTPPGLGSNAYLDGIAKELGVGVDFSVQDGSTYADKLNALLGARDVPDLLCVPSWEIPKIARFSDAVKALFEDLTDYLKGDAVSKYPMLASLPTNAWRNAVWGGRLAAVPWPTDGPFPLAMFYRKDLIEKLGLALPKSAAELYEFGKKATDPAKGVWAFNDCFHFVQMIHKASGMQGGWRKGSDGKLSFKYETAEFKAAVEFMARLYKENLIHPDIAATKGADAKQLFSSGKILTMQDGIGAWAGMYREQRKVTPTFNMQPMPAFAADGGTPLVWGADTPIFYTFIKKGLGAERTAELLGVLNWAAAPLGTKEYEMREYGIEGTHFTRDATSGAPIATPLAGKEIAFQYGFIVGRNPALISSPETPNQVEDLIGWSNTTVKFMEKDLWAGIKLEQPSNYVKIGQPTEDKITDIVRGRRPVSDLDGIVAEWRSGGGDEGRDFFAKALSENGL
jgi:putative aldouronate transport system substrate-binding protein